VEGVYKDTTSKITESRETKGNERKGILMNKRFFQVKKSKVSLYTTEKRVSALFVFPTLLFLFFTFVYPLSYSFVLSFFSWNMLVPYSKKVFVGLTNYFKIFHEPIFLSSVKKTCLFVGISVSIQFILGLGIALLITNRRIKAVGIARTILLIPMMMTPIVIGNLWRILFHATYGPINYFLNILGFPSQLWIASVEQAMISLIIVEVWWQLPISIFVLAAGIQSLPVDIYEAAEVDGSSKWQVFRYITLPLLKPVILALLLLQIMDGFKMFDIVYGMTMGGPSSATEVLSLLIYKRGLKFFRIGQATAMSWILLFIVVGIGVFFLYKFQLQKRE